MSNNLPRESWVREMRRIMGLMEMTLSGEFPPKKKNTSTKRRRVEEEETIYTIASAMEELMKEIKFKVL